MFLVTVDGRQRDSVGATLLELSNLLKQMGIDDAVNLDGGGSSTMVFQEDGGKASHVTIVNDPSDSSARLVPNGIGVYVDRARAASTKG
jgi:exopolysaccharide biosynthesis protein